MIEVGKIYRVTYIKNCKLKQSQYNNIIVKIIRIDSESFRVTILLGHNTGREVNLFKKFPGRKIEEL